MAYRWLKHSGYATVNRTLKRRSIPARPPQIFPQGVSRRTSPHLPVSPNRNAGKTGLAVMELFAVFAWLTVLWVCLRPVRRSAFAFGKPRAPLTPRRGSRREI
jgi:hypothetical protein